MNCISGCDYLIAIDLSDSFYCIRKDRYYVGIGNLSGFLSLSYEKNHLLSRSFGCMVNGCDMFVKTDLNSKYQDQGGLFYSIPLPLGPNYIGL